jgi:glycosyltransferase involved in cell wall biosynthesis
MIVSIIVPVYNVEKYLSRCLDSIIAQTFTDFECILIDDCSPDNCAAICDEYTEKDKRFKVTHKSQNEGLPKARRTGLDISSGEFVTHVDSDDWLEPLALEKLLNKQRETKADVVIGGFTRHYKDYTEKIVFDNYILTNKYMMLSDLFRKPFRIIGGKLCRKLFFEEINQPSYLVIGEDAVMNMQIMCSNTCNIIAVISDNIYNYDCSTGGMSRIILTKEMAINAFESSVFMYEYLKQRKLFYGAIRKNYYKYIFSLTYIKLFYNVPKREVIELVKKANLPYIYFSLNIKIMVYSILNCVFIINQNLYKFIIRNYLIFRKKFYK